MSRYRAELRRSFLFALPPPSVLEGLVDKWLQHQMAERAGIPCPRTFHPGSMAEVARIKDQIDYPAFLKPCVSHLWAPVFGTKGSGSMAVPTAPACGAGDVTGTGPAAETQTCAWRFRTIAHSTSSTGFPEMMDGAGGDDRAIAGARPRRAWQATAEGTPSSLRDEEGLPVVAHRTSAA